MTTTTFNLVTEPWIPAVTSTGYRPVSLTEAFAEAETTTVAAGLLEDQALHRLLLAIAYAATGAPTTGQYPQTLDTAAVLTWLETNRRHFDLLDAHAPFLQDPAMDPATPLIGAGVLDVTLGRERPKITDTRTIESRGPLGYAETAVYLVFHQFYSQGGRHTGVSASLPESPGSGMITFRPAGTIAEALHWSRIPVDMVGTAHWTFSTRPTGPGNGVTPDGELDALTWMSRAFLLHHDGHQVTGVQTATGWRRAAAADGDDSAFDAAPGRHDMAVAGSDPKKPAKAAVFDPSTGYRLSAGDPLDLVIAWERSGPRSLATHLRTALASDPTLTSPAVLATGQQLDKSLWKGAFLTEVPAVTGGFAARAQDIINARFQARRYGAHHRSFADKTGAQLLRTPLDAPEGTEDAVQQLRAALTPPHTRGSTGVAGWPVNATSMWASTGPTQEEELAAAVAALPELAGIPLSVLESDLTRDEATAALGALRYTWHYLTHDSQAAADLARVTETRIPDPDEIPHVGAFEITDAGARLWAGLAATWATLVSGPLDSRMPMPTVLRWAGQGGANPWAKRALQAITTTAPHPAALRLPLLESLHVLAGDEKIFSWRSLHHDLTHWGQDMTAQWRTAFWDKTAPIQTTPAEPAS